MRRAHERPFLLRGPPAPRGLFALAGLLALTSGCVSSPKLLDRTCTPAPRNELDTDVPFDFTKGEPLIAHYYAYPYDGPQPSWGYRLGWDDLYGCMGSADPSLPAPASPFNILNLAQAIATAIARLGDETTIQELLVMGTVPEALWPASPVRASYYLGALLRCAEQGRLIARVGT